MVKKLQSVRSSAGDVSKGREEEITSPHQDPPVISFTSSAAAANFRLPAWSASIAVVPR
jgi:hypothetical protein